MESWFCRAFHFCLPKTETKEETGKLIPNDFDPSYTPQKKSETAEEKDSKNVEGYTAVQNDVNEKDLNTVDVKVSETTPGKGEKEVGKGNLVSPPVKSKEDGEHP